MRKNTSKILFAAACVLTLCSIYIVLRASNLKEFLIGIGLVALCGSSLFGFFVERTQNIQFAEKMSRWLIIASLLLMIIGVIL